MYAISHLWLAYLLTGLLFTVFSGRELWKDRTLFRYSNSITYFLMILGVGNIGFGLYLFAINQIGGPSL